MSALFQWINKHELHILLFSFTKHIYPVLDGIKLDDLRCDCNFMEGVVHFILICIIEPDIIFSELKVGIIKPPAMVVSVTVFLATGRFLMYHDFL